MSTPSMRTPAEEKAVVQAVMGAMHIALSGRVADAIRLLATNAAILAHHGGRNALGSLYLQSGQLDRALESFEAAIRLEPASPDAHCNRGVVLQKLGQLDEALAAYDHALDLSPINVSAHLNRGNILSLRHSFEKAAAEYRLVVQLDPKLFVANLNLGLVELARGNATAALSALEDAVKLDPSNTEAQTARLRALQSLGMEFTRGLAERPRPRSSSADEMTIARARTLLELDRYREALDIVRGVESAKGLVIRSAALWNLGRREEAMIAAEAATRVDPRDAEAHMELAYLCLKAGDFGRGWNEYEYRLESPHARMRALIQKAPAWNDQNLSGKTILVLNEQGHGDTLQFLRYMRLLHERASRVSAVVQPALLTLVRSCKVPVTWHSDVKSAGQADYHIHLLSLPRLFGTRLQSIPQDVPYLEADAQISGEWSRLIGPQGFKVGIGWQGNPDFPRDHLRSIPLTQFATLAAVPSVRLISLQSIHGLAQLERLPPSAVVENLGKRISDNPEGLNEIAGVMSTLDLVVTSDTAIAHLAGALGRPVWVALSHDPDWRWMGERADSPWYPTMRLFRQKRRGDWSGVFAEIAVALRAAVERGHP